ncbi:MAG: alpha/beta hydrolase [Chloroflexi bacterium]|nr:alpha/beta hydrolase [Chloroflexota bacterium]MCC6895567.1 alpha/beta fold hydrolase [Anaerolineae bacterium]
MKRSVIRLSVLLCCVFFTLGFAGAAHAQSTTEDILSDLGGYTCPDSDFTCVKLTVPLDHFTADDDRTIDVVFGVLPATGKRKGMFITATGGPGSSGLASADGYTAAFDPSITEHFDIVFFDQRGAYQSGNLQCPNAVATFYSSNGASATPEEEAILIETAKTFSEDCITEMGVDPATLPFYGTNQAVADLEAFRQAIGDEKMWLYGESYGTQYVQTYAAAYPDHVAALILDGTVDLTNGLTEYYTEQTQAFSDMLQATLQACNDDDYCKDDFAEGDAVDFYDTLVAELVSNPAAVDFPLPDGTQAPRQFGLGELQTVVASLGYSEGDRMMLLRALAAASHGDLVPLMREFYVNLGIDPETEEAIPGSSDDYSDALYYAVECNDYAISGDTPEARAEYYVRAGDTIDNELPDLASIFYGDLPCAFWPGNPPTERPPALTLKNVPTLVLGATADPATPVQNGERVFQNLGDGYLITMGGGPHVIYGRGNACPDDLVTDFLVDEKMPSDRETTCEGYVSEPYVELAPTDASDFESPMDALDSVYVELFYTPEYYYSDGSEVVDIGCPYGGTVSVGEVDDNGTQEISLTECAFSQGFIMTGDGAFVDGGIELKVDVTGLADGHLIYSQDADYVSTILGSYGDEFFDTSSEA